MWALRSFAITYVSLKGDTCAWSRAGQGVVSSVHSCSLKNLSKNVRAQKIGESKSAFETDLVGIIKHNRPL